MKKRKILLIGWDGADWKFLTPLIDKGLMPNLEKLINGGVMGRLATLDPPLSPTLWTSIATGKRPYKHGIHGFTEPTPNGDGIRPMYITNRKCKAIWNILTQHNLKTHVVGWWPSHPAEPINGVMVSNLYQRASGRIHQPWPMLKGTVHPAEQGELYAKLRVHPEELTSNHLDPFIPRIAEIDQRRDKRVSSATKVIADCSTIHSAATYIMEEEEWDFMAVYYDAIDHFCHGFMKYHPPRRPHIPMRDYELYKDVVNGGCRYHDMMLGRLLELAGEDTTVILVSDHGFHPDHNRPNAIPKEPTGPAIEHSPYGIIVMKGEGIKKDENIFGASLLDITPTILNMLNLPVAEDMDGKVLVNAFEHLPKVETIKSWENIKGADGRHPENLEINEEDARAELQQLIELGYIEDPGDNVEKAIKSTVDENNFNLARAYMDGQQWEEGTALLEQLHEKNSETLRFAVQLTRAYLATNKLKGARRVVNHLREVLHSESPKLDLLEGTLLMGEERHKKALALFQKVEREAGQQSQLHLRIGMAYLRLNQLEAAETAVRKELTISPEDENAHFTLGRIYLKQLRYEEALNAFLDSTGLMYYQPAAHFSIGECLSEMGEYEKAVAAYDTCLQLVPSANQARQRIISIYEDSLKQPGKARKYKIDFTDKLRGTINIVSGLPRSGTSMMMQMLEAGGLDIFTDEERSADESNPRGYYEHEAVKALQRSNSFLKDGNGKTIKVIAQLLKHLPMTYRYRVVFMERNLGEIIASQQKMLVRESKKVKTDTVSLKLLKEYKYTIRKVKSWGEQQPNVEIIYIQHADTMQAPFVQAMRINDFFDGTLAVEQMASVVDNKLHREKSTN